MHSIKRYSSYSDYTILLFAVVLSALVLQCGDLIAHGLDGDAELANTIQTYVLTRIKKYFPHSSVLFLIGNNDLLMVNESKVAFVIGLG